MHTQKIKTNKPNSYLMDYSEDNENDKIFQSILIMSEKMYLMDKKEFFEIYTLNDIENSLIFLEERKNKLNEIQEIFGFKNTTNRFKDISKYLDAFTIERHIHQTESDFEYKISLLLDLIHSVYFQLYNFYLNEISIL